MSFVTERVAISAKLNAIWNETTYGKIGWENQPFEQPQNETFITIAIINFTSSQMSIGGTLRLYRHIGEVQFDIYVPQNRGSHEARVRADVLFYGFKNVVLTTSDSNTIQFKVPILRQLGVNETRAANFDDILYRHLVRCPFYRDEYV